MEILEFCVKQLRAQDVDKFELFWEKSSSLGIEINEGKLDHLSRATDEGLAIRVLKNQKLGFSYTFDLSQKALETAIRTAVDISQLMPSDPLNDLSVADGFQSVHYPEVQNYDTRGLEVPLEQKIELARKLEADAKRLDPRIKRVRKAGFNEVREEIVMVDSHGEQIKHRSTYFASGLTCVAEDGGDAVMGSDGQYSNFLDNLPTEEVSACAVHGALELLHASQAPTMVCPAVFKNSVVADLIGFLAASFSAENIDKNFSLLVGKKGERLFSEKLTLVDDGLLANGIATSPFDGEGVPARKTTLVDHGTIASYLYDSYYARKHKTTTTANSRRGGIKGPPTIGPTNLYLQKGSKSFEKLVSEAGKGIYITDVMGLHTANPVTGEFSVGASGILIENGKLTKSVKGFAIAGNLVELLQHVTDVGSDIRFWGSIGCPSLLVSKISVGGV